MFLVFFLTSSKLTEDGKVKKRRIGVDSKEGGQRNCSNSCCNANSWSSEIRILSRDLPRLITNFKRVLRGTNGAVTKTGLTSALASGTVVGLTFVLAGMLSTSCIDRMALKELSVIPFYALTGLVGSIIRSLLGAILQFSGFCELRKNVVAKPGPTLRKIAVRNYLDNYDMSLVSVQLTTLITSAAYVYIF
ncbi:Integral membrane protein-like isoform 3 [Hibiscus syriacus]|uniref:Integral membrane protein-like isoform 3 n=1 Tax=Hibiscus syriacus TaxID=106335 RepID=A0A6A2YU69_HIBSY|nr:Integral membrane protein-like isoform 3 [Hibiscus syriacus]